MDRRDFLKVVGAGAALALVPINSTSELQLSRWEGRVIYTEHGFDFGTKTGIAIQYGNKRDKDFYRHAIILKVPPNKVTEHMRNGAKQHLLKYLINHRQL